jgi:DNA processing protein
MVAIVGARRCSPYGEEVAFEIAHALATAGYIVVSGLARGIDACAHRGALASGGRTIAVMGTGPDRVYPWCHRSLAEEIAAAGALLTQFPAGTLPRPANFPQRNAVISGLSLGVVVVEARRRSGAMLTAGSAGSQGRVVMAVPGSVFSPASAGCHDLIRDGARLVSDAGDVLQELAAEPLSGLVRATPRRRLHGDARDDVTRELAVRPMTLDLLCARLRLEPREVAVAAAQLRLDGEVSLREGVYTYLPKLAAGPPG